MASTHGTDETATRTYDALLTQAAAAAVGSVRTRDCARAW
jgi:hypothetical protein